jgi:DNA-binding CsgD family transcriptional regulator
MTATYCAIIGDIRRSRSLPRRARVQQRFADAITAINREFKKEIASKFLLTLGDEFQGLLHSVSGSYRLVCRFQDLMAPVEFSFGIGVGTLSTPLKPEALGMDGEVFHRARAALEKARKSKRDILYDLDSPSLDLLNALVGLIGHERRRMTARQRQILRLMEETERQETVARRLRISQPAVSKVVSSLRHVLEAEEAVQSFLHSYKEGGA